MALKVQDVKGNDNKGNPWVHRDCDTRTATLLVWAELAAAGRASRTSIAL